MGFRGTEDHSSGSSMSMPACRSFPPIPHRCDEMVDAEGEHRDGPPVVNPVHIEKVENVGEHDGGEDREEDTEHEVLLALGTGLWLLLLVGAEVEEARLGIGVEDGEGVVE